MLSFAFPGTRAYFIRYFGACTKPPHLCIVTEYAQRGSLHDGIKHHILILVSNMSVQEVRLDICNANMHASSSWDE